MYLVVIGGSSNYAALVRVSYEGPYLNINLDCGSATWRFQKQEQMFLHKRKAAQCIGQVNGAIR